MPGSSGRSGCCSLPAPQVIQWMMLSFVGTPVRGGVLGVLALLWAGLYALAAGAAAFAGERETGTLHLLDIMPIDRRLVWAGKISFAARDDIGLTGTLLVIAAFGTDRSDLDLCARRARSGLSC